MTEKKDSVFQEALHRFTMDAAVDGAIRHLYHQGLTSEKIKEKLDFPVPLSYVEKKIRELGETGEEEEVFVRAYTAYGKPYYIRKKRGED